MIIGFVTTFAVGIICIILGILNMLGNISSLHYYHRQRVTEENRKPFGKLVGLGTVIIGLGTILLGIFLILTEIFSKPVFAVIGSSIVIISIIIGLAISFYSMKKYNHGIF